MPRKRTSTAPPQRRAILPEPRAVLIQSRVTVGEDQALAIAAREAGETQSNFIRLAVNEAIRKHREKMARARRAEKQDDE